MKTKDIKLDKAKPKAHQKTVRKKRDKIAGLITNTFGSIVFLLSFSFFVVIWICWNLNAIPGLKPFDPFPFPELQMGVSVFAIVLTISVLISQKRQARLEKINQQVEFEINVRSEKEVTKVLEMLHQIQRKLGIEESDSELEQMKEQTDIEQLHRDASN